MDTPYYERTLDSFDDDIITRVRLSENGTWYAALDVGVNSQVSDPDFAVGAGTREDAVALCARIVRDDARGIGKFAPHGLLVPGYDLHFRLMKWWAKKEAVRDAGLDPLAFRSACRAAGDANVWKAPGSWLEGMRRSADLEAEFRVALIALDAAVAAGEPMAKAVRTLNATMARTLRDNWARGPETQDVLRTRIAGHFAERGYAMPAPGGRYVVADPDQGREWRHVFSETHPGSGATVERDRVCRFVYDAEEARLVHLEIGRLGRWQAADDGEMAAVEDSLRNAGAQALADPLDCGLDASDDLPDWCPAPSAGPRP